MENSHFFFNISKGEIKTNVSRYNLVIYANKICILMCIRFMLQIKIKK